MFVVLLMSAILAIAAMPAAAAAAAPPTATSTIGAFAIVRCAGVSALMVVLLIAFACIECLFSRRAAFGLALLMVGLGAGLVHRL